MRKIHPFIILVFAFIFSLLYLHQKTQIYIQAYKLNENHTRFNKLVDKRDHLLYNFTKEISLAKLNQWAKNNNFFPLKRERLVALDLRKQRHFAFRDRLTFLLNRFLKLPTGSSTALAEDRE